MKLYGALLMIFFMSFAVRAVDYSNLYQPFQRDLILLINWNESLESLPYSFDPRNEALFSSGIGSVAHQLATALYQSSVPIMCSLPTWAALLERAQFITDAHNLSQEDFVSTYLAIYTEEPRGQKSLLVDPNFLIKLYQFCRKAYDIYQETNQIITQGLTQPQDLKTIRDQIHERFKDPTLQGLLTTQQDNNLWLAINRFMLSYIVVQKFKNEQDQWILRCADAYICIMIPKSYVEGIKKQVEQCGRAIGMKSFQEVLTNSIKDHDTNNFLTVDELILGIKFEKFPVFDPFAPITLQDRARCTELGSVVEVSDRFIHQENAQFKGILPNILINARDFATFTKNQFLQRSESAWMPQYYRWNIFGMGHGSRPSETHPSLNTIMGLRQKAFTTLLDFFDSINTHVFYYSSCYSGGTRLWSLYSKQQDTLERKKFHYTIAAEALSSEALPHALHAFMPPAHLLEATINKETRSLQPVFMTNFGKFFSNLHTFEQPDSTTNTKKPATYKEIFSHLTNFTYPDVAATAQIRPTGLLWFHVIDLGTSMLRLTQTFVQAQEAAIKEAQLPEEQKLTLNNKTLLLIDAAPIWQAAAGNAHSEIPFPLEVHGNFPLVISMVMGDAWHSFDKIDAKDFGLLDIATKFWGMVAGMPHILTRYGRTYYIKELVVRSDLRSKQAIFMGMHTQDPLILKDVYIFVNAASPHFSRHNAQDQGIILRYNNQLFTAIFPSAHPAEVAKMVRKHRLPNLKKIKIALPMLSSTELIKTTFPQETKEASPSFEKIAQLVAGKRQKLELINQYEAQKKAEPQVFEAWKKTLGEKDVNYIAMYEAQEEFRKA